MSKYLMGYAGIPFEYFDGIVNSKSSILEGNSDFYGSPMFRGQRQCGPKDIEKIIGYFSKQLRESEHSVNKAGFALIYVVSDQDAADLVGELVPHSILPVPVLWNPVYGSNREQNEARNRLKDLLRSATRRAKKVLDALAAELSERANRTPLLLPLRNFDSNYLVPIIAALPQQLILAADPVASIRQACGVFELQHRPALCQECHPPQYFYFDRRGIKFRAPGKGLHGAAHPATQGHPDRCVLAARRRLGAPFHHSFHYDCSRPPAPVMQAHLFQCHSSSQQATTGKPHLNIAPNDYIR